MNAVCVIGLRRFRKENRMRAIDADALMKAMYHRAFETDGDTMWQSGCWVRYRAIEQVVKEQPTIEPERKKGKWTEKEVMSIKESEAIEQWQSCKCSVCGRYNTRPYMYYFDEPKFCSWCGSDMR